MKRTLILLLLFWFVSCTSSADPSFLVGPTPVTKTFPSPSYGIHTSIWWRPEIVLRDLDTVREMGFTWVKQPVSWREIEGIEKGKYDWYRLDEMILPAIEARNLKFLARIDHPPFWTAADPTELYQNAPPANYADFGDFCHTLATRYKGRIHAYQVWNEPNLHREWGMRPPNPVEYTALLKVCYEGIKSADPQAVVISAGLAPTATHDETAMPDSLFLQEMYQAGAAAYFDVLGLNAPGYAAPPELAPQSAESDPRYGGRAEFTFRHVETMRQIMLDNQDGAKQVAILEMGWITYGTSEQTVPYSLTELHPNYAWFAVDEATQADYLVRAYQYAKTHWQPWIGLMTTVYLADYDWTPTDHEQWWWSITLPDGTPRPAYHALKTMEK